MRDPLRILQVITGLGVGGAERMLERLVLTLASRGVDSEVVSISELGPIGESLRRAGVRVDALNMLGPTSGASALFRLARQVRERRSHVIHTWMYHADLLGGVVGRLFAGAPVIWSIRNGSLSERNPLATRAVARACAAVSSWVPARIVSCSGAATAFHAQLGYDERRFVLIPNGLSLDEFRPDPAARSEVRQELGIGDETPVAGMMGRYTPEKDHPTLLRAFAELSRSLPDTRLVLCGSGCDAENAELASLARALGIAERLVLLGNRADPQRVYNALDVHVLSSKSEAFPNVLAEAMACGVPCVTTSAGDAPEIAGPTGSVVRPQQPVELAERIRAVLCRPEPERRELGLLGRDRVMKHFEIGAIADRYEALYRELAGSARASKRC